jgi:WD40 repeat protein
VRRWFPCLLLIALLGSCAPVTPVATATKTVPEIVSPYTDLEVITPENVGRLEEIARLGDGYFVDAALSPDGKVLAVATTRTITFYDASTLELVNGYKGLEISKLAPITTIAFSPDGKYIAAAQGLCVNFYNLTTGEIEDRIITMVGYTNIYDIKYSLDGTTILIESKDTDNVARVLEGVVINFALYQVGNPNPLYNHFFTWEDMVTSRFVSGNQLYIFWITQSENHHVVIDTSTGNILKIMEFDSYKENVDIIYDVSKDGKVFAAMENTSSGKVYKLLDAETQEVLDTSKDWMFPYSPDSIFRWTYSTENGGEWQKSDGTISCRFPKRRHPPEFISPDGKTAILMDWDELVLWDMTTCQRKGAISYHGNHGPIRGLSVSPDGRALAYQDLFRLFLQDIQTGEIHSYELTDANQSYEFSPDGSKMYAAVNEIDGKYSTVAEIDVASGRVTRNLKYKSETSFTILAVTANRIVLGKISGIINIWDLDADQSIRVISAHTFDVDIRSDGTEMLVVERDEKGPAYNRLLRVDSKTGKTIRELTVPGVDMAWYGPANRAFVAFPSADTTNKYLFKYAFVDLEDGRVESEFMSPPDARGFPFYAALGDKNLFIFFDNGKIQMRQIDDLSISRTIGKLPDLYGGLTLSPDRKLLLSYGWTGTGSPASMQFRDAVTGEFLTEIDIDRPMSSWSVVFGPDQRFIAMSMDDGTIRLWGVKKP